MFLKIALEFFAAFILGIVSVATAEDVTSQKKASIRLHAPYTTLLPREKLIFSVTVCNNLLPELHYLPFGSRLDLIEEYERLQLFFETKHNSPTPWPIHTGHERIYSVEKDGNWEKIINFEAAAVLKPTETVTWHYKEVNSQLLKTMWFFQAVKGLQAKFLIGPNQWISSNIVPIRRAEPDKEPVLVLEPNYIGTMKTGHKVQFNRISIHGKEYLFCLKSFRICEIPKGYTPEFTWEPRLGLLKITFSAANRPRQTLWYSIQKVRTLNASQLTEYYQEAYNFKYGDADYRQRALKGMASHGTAASVQLFDQYEGNNELLLQHRDRYECMRLLLERAQKKDDVKQARQLILQALFAGDLQLDKKRITLPPLVRQENEAQKTAEFIDEFVKNTGPTVLTKGDRAKIATLISNIEKAVGKTHKPPSK